MSVIRLVMSAVLAMASGAASSQSYPTKPVTIVVPYQAGAGAGDRIGRMIAAKLAERLGKPVMIENRPGADATIGAVYVINAKPDGYTIYQGDSGPLAIVPALRKVSFDPAKDLIAVGPIVTMPYVLGVSAKLGVKSVGDLVKLAKSKPGTLNYASSSAMVVLGMELFKKKTDTDIVHIPFGGASGAILSILGGQTSMMFLNPLAFKPYIDSGQIIALAIAAPSRAAVLPDVPTFDELGIAGVDVQTYLGLFAPRGTPREIMAKLNKALADVMSDTAVQKELTSQGTVVINDHSAENFAKELDQDREKWRRVVSDAGLGEK